MAEQHLTPKELVERWGGKISFQTLTNWRSRGRKNGPSFRYMAVYPLSSVEAYERRHPELRDEHSALAERALEHSEAPPAHDEVAPSPRFNGYLTPRELVERWNGAITVKTLANWRSDPLGKGPPFRRYFSKILYPLSGIEEYERLNGLGSARDQVEDDT